MLLLLALATGAALGGVVIANVPAALPAIPLSALVLVIGAALLWDHSPPSALAGQGGTVESRDLLRRPPG